MIDPRPVNLPHRRLPPYLVAEVREQLQALVNKGIVRKSCSSYASPIVPVRKKDCSLRFCVDYRQLNEKTVRDAFPLPRIEESLESLGGARLFSSLDLSHGYFQVKVHPNSVHLTAFRVPWGLYEFVRLPQGLMNSPSTFQRIMEYIFGDLNMRQLLLYLDDILVFSSDYEEHISRLDEVLKRLIDAGLKLKGKKCHLFCHQVEYLGHVVSGEGVSADPGKVERINEWPVPQNSEELSSFLGLASYYRRFMPRFAEISAPLNALRVNKHGRAPTREFSWNSEADQAFAKLKNALSSPPVLAYPVYGQDFVVEVDASFKGLGACLGQKDKNGHLHPIAYASRGLRGSEKRYPDYSSFKLELLGLKWAIADKFGGHLLGHHTIVLTDNNPLAHLASAKLGATEQRWIAKLAPYDLEIRYRSGHSNRAADALSRNPLNQFDFHVDRLICEGTNTTSIPLGVRESEVAKGPDESQFVAPGVLPAYSHSQLVDLQRSDPLVRRVWSRKEIGWVPGQEEPDNDVPGLQGWLREYDRYIIHNGLLYRQYVDPITGPTRQLLIPGQLQSVLLEAAHDQWGHQGVARTYALLKSRCYWPGLHSQVKSYVKRCLLCTVAKARTPKARPLMQHLLAFRPLELLAIDFLKVDRGRHGMEDILVCTDAFTKWAQATPCSNQLAVTVAKKLRDCWFTVYGIPSRLHSDQGRNFESQLIHELCQLYGIRKSRTTPYHAQGNPQTERFNKTLCGLIKSLDQAHRNRWPDLLSHLVFIYNTTPHCVTGVSPYTLMFGREPCIPIDYLVDNLHSNWDEDFVSLQADMMGKAWEVVRQRIEKAAEASKARYDQKARATPLEIGQRVLLQRTGFLGGSAPED